MKNLALSILLLFPALAWAIMQRREGQGDALVPDYPFYEPDDLPFTLDVPSFSESIGIDDVKYTTRGERNNNPGNIRISSSPWIGKVDGTDSAFESFVDPESGIRALAVLLKTYANRYNLNTVRGIITRYAPASENNTGSYVAHVSSMMGTGPDDRLNLADPATMAALIRAIITHENGRNLYTDQQINNGVQRA